MQRQEKEEPMQRQSMQQQTQLQEQEEQMQTLAHDKKDKAVGVEWLSELQAKVSGFLSSTNMDSEEFADRATTLMSSITYASSELSSIDDKNPAVKLLSDLLNEVSKKYIDRMWIENFSTPPPTRNANENDLTPVQRQLLARATNFVTDSKPLMKRAISRLKSTEPWNQTTKTLYIFELQSQLEECERLERELMITISSRTNKTRDLGDVIHLKNQIRIYKSFLKEARDRANQRV